MITRCKLVKSAEFPIEKTHYFVLEIGSLVPDPGTSDAGRCEVAQEDFII